MAERRTRERHFAFIDLVLTNTEVAEKGHIACLDTATSGEVAPAQDSTTLIPIGYFTQNLTGDGTKKVNIRLFREIRAQWFDNDATNAVAASHIGEDCYLSDTAEVSSLSTGRSVAGKVWAIDSAKGVLVEPATNIPEKA